MNPRVLYLFTNGYPYGTSEPFLENELVHLAKAFSSVVIVTNAQKGREKMRSVPANVTVREVHGMPAEGKGRVLRENLFLVLKLLVGEIILGRQKALFIKNFRSNLYLLLHSIHAGRELKIDFNGRSDNYFYSYWFFDWNLVLSLLRSAGEIDKNYTRAHGFDIYEDNGKPNYLPFRKFCLANTDKIFTVSETGRRYLRDLYPRYEKKIFTAYLGTLDHGLSPGLSPGDNLTLLSCSNLVAVKRPQLILEILKRVQCNVNWIHIGSGDLYELVLAEANRLPPNVQFKLTGRLTSKQIFELYSTTPVDCFINCSISEGLPVSIMEAISFGIPVVATDVGGTKEIVNAATGILIPRDFNIENVANLLCGIKDRFRGRRESIRDFWCSNFNAESNYPAFLSHF